MKKYLIAVCAAAVLVGCARDRGGVYNRSSSESGRSSTMQSTNSISDTNNTQSGTPQSSGTQGSTSERSSGAGSQDNQPKN